MRCDTKRVVLALKIFSLLRNTVMQPSCRTEQLHRFKILNRPENCFISRHHHRTMRHRRASMCRSVIRSDARYPAPHLKLRCCSKNHSASSDNCEAKAKASRYTQGRFCGYAMLGTDYETFRRVVLFPLSIDMDSFFVVVLCHCHPPLLPSWNKFKARRCFQLEEPRQTGWGWKSQ